MRGFYALPLNDDTGRVGILSLESSDPDFLSPIHIEMLQVLASQATVALRNAQMYKEVPFISVLEPVLDRKRKFMAWKKRGVSPLRAGADRGADFSGDLSAAHAAGRRCLGGAGASRAGTAGI